MRKSLPAELLRFLAVPRLVYDVAMRRLVLAVLLVSVSLVAQSKRKPLFPLPSSLRELPKAASVAPELPAAIARELVASSCKPNGNESYGVAEIDLKREGAASIIRVEEPCLCGASGNCPIFVVLRSKVVLRDGDGFAFAQIDDPKGGGTPDLLIASHTSANVTALQRYRWKGGRYKLQDCEAAVRKDDARSATWNPEELDVASCDAIALK